jgi:hypothetical protein
MQALLLHLERAVQFVAWIAVPSAADRLQRTAEESEHTTLQAEVKKSWQGALKHFSTSRLIKRYVNPAQTIYSEA